MKFFFSHRHVAKNKNFIPKQKPSERVEDLLLEYSRKFTYEELLDKKYPKAIDTSRLEDLLEDSEFERIFETTREIFQNFPLWKKQKIKRELGLY